jgi:hypothetical protein
MKVDIMCVGAAKSGTSWLAHVLGQHPELFIPRQKEIHYFNSHHPIRLDANPNFKKPLDWYHSYFEGARKSQLKADFSTSYLSFSSAAESIYDYNPESKVIVLLRNPIDRAVSAQRFLYGRGLIKYADFFEAVTECSAVGEDGKYYSKLLPYYKRFSAEQIGVFFYDDLIKPELLINQICEFLNLSPFHFELPKSSINKTKSIRNKALHSAVTWFKLSTLGTLIIKSGVGGFFNRFYDWNSQNTEPEVLSPEIRGSVRKYYEDDLLKLESLIQKPLNRWK